MPPPVPGMLSCSHMFTPLLLLCSWMLSFQWVCRFWSPKHSVDALLLFKTLPLYTDIVECCTTSLVLSCICYCAIISFQKQGSLSNLLACPCASSPPEGSGVVIAVIIICILLLAILGSVLYFLYKKGKIGGRAGKQDLWVSLDIGGGPHAFYDSMSHERKGA